MGSSDEAMAMQGNCSQGNGNENNGISRCNQASANKPEIENTEGGNSVSICYTELQGSSNPNVLFSKSDDSLPYAQPNLDDQNPQEQLPPLGENPDGDSEQGEPLDDLQESSESDNPPGTNPRCDYSSDQSCTSSASRSAGDGKLTVHDWRVYVENFH